MVQPDVEAVARGHGVERQLDSLLSALHDNLVRRGAHTASFGAVLEQQIGGDAASGLFARAPRLVGREPARFEPEQLAMLGRHVSVWSVDLLARVVLLTRLSRTLAAAELDAWLERVYRHGEARERAAVLQSLVFLPEPARFVPLASDACRSHVLPVFEAIACDNPYPCDHFSDHTFRHMVLKAVFVEVSIARIVGLDRRADPELARMARDYASERRAAGRSVSDDVSRLCNG